MNIEKLQTLSLLGLNLARSGLYFLESIPLSIASRNLAKPTLPPPSNEQLAAMWRYIYLLHEREAEDIAKGVYSWRTLDLESPLRHGRNYLEILRDSASVLWRMRSGNNKAFSKAAEDLAKELPEYYVRNFHFQTDGYLSESSAKRYDHQVEILFAGAAGAMRRRILPILKSAPAGDWLELGCGNGTATYYVLQQFPAAHLTALDLSAPYLKIAQKRLRDFHKVGFVLGDATQLKFKDASFDCVYSVFVPHELPRSERNKFVDEAFRVAKPGSLVLIADSLQEGDTPELDWALDRFPKAYHEPFYRDYTLDPLEEHFRRNTRQPIFTEKWLFTKIVWTIK